MGISSHEGNGACTGRCHCVPFPFSPPSAWVWASVAWLTSGKVPEASSASSYGQLRHNPPWVGAELDLRLRGDDIFNFMLNPALAECIHFAGRSGDTEWIRPDSPHEGTHSPIGDITHASPSILWEPTGEMYLAFTWGMHRSIWADLLGSSPNIFLLFLIVLQIWGKLLGSYIDIMFRRQPHLMS